jgi:hypothetical protein
LQFQVAHRLPKNLFLPSLRRIFSASVFSLENINLQLSPRPSSGLASQAEMGSNPSLSANFPTVLSPALPPSLSATEDKSDGTAHFPERTEFAIARPNIAVTDNHG